MILISKLYNRLIIRPFLRLRLKSVGKNFRLGHSSVLKPAKIFSIGDNFFTGPCAYFSSNTVTQITIGSDVMFGPYCKVIGGNHNITWTGGVMSDAPFLGKGEGIVIQDDVWIGAGATLLDGACVSEGAVIAAGAVVTGYIPPYCVAGGVPAKVIKPRFTDKELSCVLESKKSSYSTSSVRKNFATNSVSAHQKND